MSEVKCRFESQGFGTWACNICGRQVLFDPLGHTMTCIKPKKDGEGE